MHDYDPSGRSPQARFFGVVSPPHESSRDIVLTDRLYHVVTMVQVQALVLSIGTFVFGDPC